MNKNVKLITIGNEIWSEMRDNTDAIQKFLKGGTCSKLMGSYLYNSLRLVLIELISNKSVYEKYPSKYYSEEDFVDLVIESCGTKIPSINDIEGNNIFSDEIRTIMWGHIKNKYVELILLMKEMKQKDFQMEQKYFNLLRDCLTVIFVEVIIRKREIQLLENIVL